MSILTMYFKNEGFLVIFGMLCFAFGSVQSDSGMKGGFSSFTSFNDREELQRNDFPKYFLFGVATSAYQIEGATFEGGRGSTIWYTFVNIPGKISDNKTGAVTADQYHHYRNLFISFHYQQEDVELVKHGCIQYHFSIAWSRTIPDGMGQTLNMEGVAYYNNLIDALLEKGITPYVTIYHWDLPQPLQDNLGGWVNPEIVKHYAYYADTCFNMFGDRVKHWITFNEPTQICVNGYGTGLHAPGRSSNRTVSNNGNSSIEPYLAAHNILIAHGTVVKIYRSIYQFQQEGTIGFTIDCDWSEPLSNSEEDKEATDRHRAFQLGWWLDPIFIGDYPIVMRQNVGDRLPQFTEVEKLLLQNSVDFVGLNHYTTLWVTSLPFPLNQSQGSMLMDQGVLTTVEKDGILIGEKRLIEYVWKTYNTPIYICEDGVDEFNNKTLPIKDALKDVHRVDYYREYIMSMYKEIESGADVRAYIAWSLMDNFEWAAGFTSRFGLYYVDFETQMRYPKDSAKWFSKFLKSEGGPHH